MHEVEIRIYGNVAGWLVQYDRRIRVYLDTKARQLKALLETENYIPDALSYGGNGWFAASYNLTASESLNAYGDAVKSIKESYEELPFVKRVRAGQKQDGQIRIRFLIDMDVLPDLNDI